MPNYEVEYSWDEPQYGIINVIADSLDHAEEVALEQLSDTLEPDIAEMSIESIKEIKS